MATAVAPGDTNIVGLSEVEKPRPLKPRPLKKGLFQRMRRGSKKHNHTIADPTKVDGLVEAAPTASEKRQDFTDEYRDIARKSKDAKVLKFSTQYHSVSLEKEVKLEKPPTARQAAYGGPPRYDWIDIETSAAVKVQSIYRRNKTMEELENQGITTAAIRNRARRRQARMDARGATGSADIPSLFACCGVGLAFGDATEEAYEASRQHQREKYYQKKTEKENQEAQLREKFKHMEAQKKAARPSFVKETYEVVA